jgi:hypothetical protein
MYASANLCIAGHAVRLHIPDKHLWRCHMKEEQDISGTAQPKEESKRKKYIRIALTFIFISFFVLVFVMAALNRYGS